MPTRGGGALLESTQVGPRDVLGEKNRVTFLEKPNSSPQDLRPKVISHSFWPFLKGPPWVAFQL